MLRIATFCTVLLASLLPAFAAPRGENRPPNILLLVTDDQRWDALGAAGNPVIRTPHLDGLAARGVLFTHCFCTTSICATSRASLLSGQWARRHGIHDFATSFTPRQWRQTFPAVLRRHGYRVGFVGKWGVGRTLPREKYDYFAGFAGQGRYFDPRRKQHMTDHLADQAVKFLESCTAEQPFCLQVSFKAAHCQDGQPWRLQFQPARRYASLYRDVTIPPVPAAREEFFRRLPPFLQTSEARRRWKVRFANPEMYQYSVKNYYRLLTGVDDAVGRMLAVLQRRGLADNTVVIFTSDNGFYLGDYGLAGKWFMHEPSIRLPLVIYDPRLPSALAGRRLDPMVLTVDLAPTILHLAGAPIPSAMQGKSLVPLLQGRCTAWRQDFFYEHLFRHRRIPQSEGVRTRRWKYVRYLLPDGPYEQLFDLAGDPLEVNDLARDTQHQNLLRLLRRRCDELARQLR